MDKLKIVFVSAAAGRYGAENALLEVIEALPETVEPIVILPSHGDLEVSLNHLGVMSLVAPIAVLDRKYFNPIMVVAYKVLAIRSTFRLVKLFRKLRPDIVHTNNVLILPGALAARMLGIPHVWHIREIVESHHIHRWLWKIWRTIILSFSAQAVCISETVRSQFPGSTITTVVHDGINAEFFRPTSSGKRRSDKNSLSVTFGLVGKFEHRRKGQDTFLEAARIALRSRRDLHFVIAGDVREGLEENERSIIESANEGELKGHVDIRGLVPRDKMPSLINELDVLVLCSKQPEGLGIVLLEAMACGKAVVSFAEGGPLDIIHDRENGLLVPPQDTAALAAAMVELAENAGLRKRLGVEGRKSVVTEFQSEMTAKRMVEVYRSVVKENRWVGAPTREV